MMNFLGLKPEDYAAETTVFVWPDNVPAVNAFAAFRGGDWSIGQNGPTGLRSETFREKRLELGLTVSEWRELLPDIQRMESAALDEMHKE